MPINSTQVIELSSNPRRVRYSFTDHLGRTFNRYEKDVADALDADTNILSLVSQFEDELAGMEIQEAVQIALSGNNPDKVAEHQAQGDFDRRVLGRLMLLSDLLIFNSSMLFFRAVEVRAGNPPSNRYLYLGVTTEDYDLIEVRYNQHAGSTSFLTAEKDRVWTELPEVFE